MAVRNPATVVAAPADDPPATAPPPAPAEAPVPQTPDRRLRIPTRLRRRGRCRHREPGALGEAKTRLDAARDSIVQIRGFSSGPLQRIPRQRFRRRRPRQIVTNYHVVSQAVLYPRQYRLEYLTTIATRAGAGPRGRHTPRPRHRQGRRPRIAAPAAAHEIPAQGARACSIGFPLNLGLTITEGVANGLVENSFDQRIHYTGAINSGMSGGPALDAGGRCTA